MNKGRISISIFLCFLVMMFLMVMGCSSSSDEPAGSASLSSLNASGLDSLSQGNIPEAKAYFKAAVKNYPGDTTNDGDTARFFYAFTRIAGINLNSDGNSADLNSVGDILDRAGCSTGGRSLMNSTMTCPKTLPSDFPTGSEMQTFAYDVIRPELEAALANLGTVSSSFTKRWTEPISSKPYTSDYGDVLVLRAAIKGALAAIYIQYAYNLNADIGVEVNAADNTAQTFFSRNGDFLKLKTSGYGPSLTTARTYLSEVADDLTAAITKIQTRNTAVYLINLVDMTTPEIDDAKAKITSGKASLTAQTTVYEGADGIPGNGDDVIINLSFFFAGLDLRDLLPTFTGNTPGTFPHPTMGGIIVQGLND